MRRILNGVTDRASEFARSLARDWDAFWFAPADPTLLGLIRILTGLMLLYTHAVWGVGLDDFFGPSAWLSADLVRTLQRDAYAFSFWWWVPSWGMWPAYAASMAVLAAFAAGLWTRITSILALVVAISFAQRVPVALFGLDQINVMLTLYLAIGPSGAALSVDRRLARRRGGAGALRTSPTPSSGANLALRLIQVHMCVIYFFAGISKLQGPAWWDGEAMWRAFSNLEYQSADMTWLAHHPWLINLGTHTSVLWEISFAALIWSRRWRPLVLAVGVGLHLGIGAFLGMWTFGLVMLIGCASFLPPDGVRRLVDALISPRRGSVAMATSSSVRTPTPARRPGRNSGADAPEPALSGKRDGR